MSASTSPSVVELPLRCLWSVWIVFCLFYLNIYDITLSSDPFLSAAASAFTGDQLLGWPRAFLFYDEWSTKEFLLDSFIWVVVIVGWTSILKRALKSVLPSRFSSLAGFLVLVSLVAFCIAEPGLRNYHDETDLDRLDDICYASAAVGFSFACLVFIEYLFRKANETYHALRHRGQDSENAE